MGVSARLPAKAVVLYFFDRTHGGDGLGSFDRLHRQYSGKGVVFVGVFVDQGELGPLAA